MADAKLRAADEWARVKKTPAHLFAGAAFHAKWNLDNNSGGFLAVDEDTFDLAVLEVEHMESR